MKRICILLLLAAAFGVSAQVADTAGSQVARDENGRPITSVHDVYDSHDRLAVRICYHYDSTGVVRERVLESYDKRGMPRRKEVYSADEYLLFVEEKRWADDHRMTMFRTISYDEDGKAAKDTYRYYYFRNGRRIYCNGKLILHERNGKIVTKDY